MTQISRKFDFLPGTKIYSNQIDDEFNQLISESNAQDTRIVAVEADKHSHTNKTVLDKITQSGAESSFDLSNFATKGEASSVTAHKSTHASGGSDALTPEDIGAEPSIGVKGTAFNKSFGSAAGMVAEGNHFHTRLDVLDTRSLDYKPNEYLRGRHEEFKVGSTVGLTAEQYAVVETIRPWTDDSAGLTYQIGYGLTTGKQYVRTGSEATWDGWKEGGGKVSYKTYTSTLANTNLSLGAAFDLNLVNITGKGFVDILTGDVGGINISLADGIEMIVDGQVLWSFSSTSGSTNGVMIDPNYPLVGESQYGNSGNNAKFDRVYFSSSFRVRIYGTAAATGSAWYGVPRFSYHLEQ